MSVYVYRLPLPRCLSDIRTLTDMTAVSYTSTLQELCCVILINCCVILINCCVPCRLSSFVIPPAVQECKG
jgi:hypothetical protein